MARLLIRQVHGGETVTIRDGALPYFINNGWIVLDTLDDSTDATPLYLSKAESDFRYPNISELGDPASAGSVAVRSVIEEASSVNPTGAWDFAQAPTVAGSSIGGGAVAAADITDSTTTGRAVLTAADAATARAATGTPAKSAVEGIMIHDGTAGGGTRPTGYARVRWVGGTARPTNMATGDVWEHDA